ncbi:hypothetical protein CCMA1212_003565 [Trichoderma ghanense]|uniref:Uncharacterized protein n=1 Tax=Trichoderma ghanense TaxID=65468 RepID=A0ABY2H9A3_9HYPO
MPPNSARGRKHVLKVRKRPQTHVEIRLPTRVILIQSGACQTRPISKAESPLPITAYHDLLVLSMALRRHCRYHCGTMPASYSFGVYATLRHNANAKRRASLAPGVLKVITNMGTRPGLWLQGWRLLRGYVCSECVVRERCDRADPRQAKEALGGPSHSATNGIGNAHPPQPQHPLMAGIPWRLPGPLSIYCTSALTTLPTTHEARKYPQPGIRHAIPYLPTVVALLPCSTTSLAKISLDSFPLHSSVGATMCGQGNTQDSQLLLRSSQTLSATC